MGQNFILEKYLEFQQRLKELDLVEDYSEKVDDRPEIRYTTEDNLCWWADGSLQQMMMMLPISQPSMLQKPHM